MNSALLTFKLFIIVCCTDSLAVSFTISVNGRIQHYNSYDVFAFGLSI